MRGGKIQRLAAAPRGEIRARRNMASDSDV
jgi:hypothetical protein